MSALNRVKLLGRENCDSLTVYQADAEQKLLDQAAARKAEERQERREQRAADSRVLRAEVESLRTEVERLRTELLEAERRQIEGLELTAEHIAQLADRIFNHVTNRFAAMEGQIEKARVSVVEAAHGRQPRKDFRFAGEPERKDGEGDALPTTVTYGKILN